MQLVETILAHDSHINCVRFAPKGSLVSAGMDNLVKVWSPKDWSLQKTLEGHENSANSLSFSPDGKLLATSSTDKSVRLWQWPSGKPKQVLNGHKKPTVGARFSPDGRLLASSSYDDRIRIWSVKDGECLQELKPGKRRFACAFVGDTQLLTANETGKFQIWNIENGQVETEVDCPAKFVGGFTPSPDKKLMAFADYVGAVLVVDVKTWRLVQQFKVGEKGIFPLSFSPDSSVLAAGWDNHVALFSLNSKKEIVREKVKPKGIYSLDFSADGKLLAMGAADKRIRIWKI